MAAVADELAKYVESAPTNEVMRQMHLLGTGSVRELEEKLEALYGMRYALCVSSATTGLLALALALDLKGEEFVTTPMTHPATLASWLIMGMTPVFCDVNTETLTLDPASVRRRVTSKTRALLAVDILGIPADMVKLRELADEAGIWYIADAAQSLGARAKGRPASSLAHAMVVSFTAGKPLEAGEGGAILTNDPDIYERLLRWCQHPSRQRRELSGTVDEFSINGRIHPLAAIWANARFDDALLALEVRQARCFEFIDVLNASGLAEPISFKSEGLDPTFFRMTAAWQGRPRRQEMLALLGESCSGGRIGPFPLTPLYESAAFRARYPSFPMRHCRVAETQARRRFSLLDL